MVYLAKTPNPTYRIRYKHISNVYSLFLAGSYYIFQLCFVDKAKMWPRNWKIL